MVRVFNRSRIGTFTSMRDTYGITRSSRVPRLIGRTIRLTHGGCLTGRTARGTKVCTSIPPRVPTHLPGLVGLLADGIPTSFGTPITVTIFPPLTTRLGNIGFHCVSGRIRRTTVVGLLMTPVSSNGSTMGKPVSYVVRSLIRVSGIGHRGRRS